jgi:hypothetical protein
MGLQIVCALQFVRICISVYYIFRQKTRRREVFRRTWANTYLGPSTSAILEAPPPKMRKGKACQALPPRDVILDGVEHEQIRNPERMRCMFPSCKLKTVTMCSKCKVHQCAKKSKDCFNDLLRR